MLGAVCVFVKNVGISKPECGVSEIIIYAIIQM